MYYAINKTEVVMTIIKMLKKYFLYQYTIIDVRYAALDSISFMNKEGDITISVMIKWLLVI